MIIKTFDSTDSKSYFGIITNITIFDVLEKRNENAVLKFYEQYLAGNS